MAMPTPRPSRQQLAAAATQLRGGVGRGPQRVFVARVSTALETSAATSRWEDGRAVCTMRAGARWRRPTGTMAATSRQRAAEWCTEAWAAAALGTTRPSRRRGRLPRSVRIRSTAGPRIGAAAAEALATVERWRMGWRSSGTRFIVRIADLLDIVGVTGLEGMSGGKGATGQFPDASTLHCAAVNMIYMVIGTGEIASVEGPLSVERAHCDLLHPARCQDLSHRLLTDLNVMTVPYSWMRLAQR